MQISHGTRIKNMNPACGYGYATDRMIWALRELGHVVEQNNPTAPVQFWFDQPEHWKWNNSAQYRIGYHPWESSQLRPGWAEKMNEADEIWTPSPLIAQWYKDAGIKPPVYTYLHGVDKVWTPKERVVSDTFNFLHVGAEAMRKGGYELIRAFRQAFPFRNDVTMTLKMINPGWNVPMTGRLNLINRTLGLHEMVDLFHEHHAYLYPSWGEGFGLTPLQAMATGMPTLTLPAWAPYAHHLDPRLSISSKRHPSEWQKIHPGDMFKPDLDDMVDKMRWVVDNYDSAHTYAHAQVAPIVAEYDWLRLTDETFSGLESRLKIGQNL